MDFKNFGYHNFKKRKRFSSKIKPSKNNNKVKIGGILIIVFFVLVVYFLLGSWVPRGYYLQSLGYDQADIARISSKQINKKVIINEEQEMNLSSSLENLGLSLTEDYYQLLFPKTELVTQEDQQVVCFSEDKKMSLEDKKGELDAWTNLILKMNNPQQQEFTLSDGTRINQLIPASGEQFPQSRNYEDTDYSLVEVNSQQLVYGVVNKCVVATDSEEVFQEVIEKSLDRSRKSIIGAKFTAVKDIF